MRVTSWKTWLSVGGCAFASLALFGCATDVNGVVRDATTLEPIEGATVRIGDEAATTDEQGYYSLDVDEDDDPQTFRVEAVGYSDVADERRVTGDVNPAYVDFNLRPADGPTPSWEGVSPPASDSTTSRPWDVNDGASDGVRKAGDPSTRPADGVTPANRTTEEESGAAPRRGEQKEPAVPIEGNEYPAPSPEAPLPESLRDRDDR
jgi:hypothetical protein